MPYKSDAQVLMALLKRVPDAKKVERLLEPDNLLFLLKQYGRSEEDVKQHLESGAFPGELLLELLSQEPNADRLLAQLPESVPVQDIMEKPSRLVADDSTSRTYTDYELRPPWPKPHPFAAKVSRIGLNIPREMIQFVVGMIIFFTSLFPSMLLFNYADEIHPPIVFTNTGLMLIAFVGGVLAGIVAYPLSKSYFKSILVAVILNVGIIWATIQYMNGGQEWISSTELRLSQFLGAAPGALLFYLFFGRKRR